MEVLPDRFDKDGRRVDRSRGGGLFGGSGGGGQSEMMERVVRDIGDVVDGRKSLKDLIGDLVGNGGGSRDSGGGSAASRRRRD